MLDFFGNLLGALLGTGAAFLLGTFSERKTRKRQQLEKIKRLKKDIVRNVRIMNSTDFKSAYYIENFDKVSILVRDIQSQFNSLELANASLDDELGLMDLAINPQSLDKLQQSWFEFRTQYISKFNNACSKYVNTSSKDNAKEDGKFINAAKVNLDKKITVYLESLEFIDSLK